MTYQMVQWKGGGGGGGPFGNVVDKKHMAHRIVPLVQTLLTASQVIPFTLQVKHAPSLHTLLVTLKM